MAEHRPELPVEYEPQLVEEAVLAAMRGRPEEAEFRAHRDTLYLIGDAEEREMRFRVFHTTWFERLRLGDAIAGAIREQPSIALHTHRCLVAPAPSRREEGAELFVAGGGGGSAGPRRTIVLRVRPETFTEVERFRALLRHELCHLADMLDPRFGYAPGLVPLGATLPDPLLRERYRVLWDAAIDGRLQRLGWAPTGVRVERLREFAATFPMLGEQTEEAFERFFGATALTHADLVRFALAPERALGLAPSGHWPGEPCPLCGLPTHAFEPDPKRLPRTVCERIHRRFPRWRPADGLCRQCADLYRAAAGAGTQEAVQ
jgi:hypothetical protein